MKTYKNPIVRGFFPDPSIIRTGDDYYMVNSSFQYFPALPIHHSKDLVNWELVGHAITNNDYLDISELSDSHGIWAPDISCFDGKYYIFATLRLNNPLEGIEGKLRQTLVMKSDKPYGPYSKPVVLDLDYIDPSHFIDDDGSHYCITAPGITITKLSNDCTQIDGETKCVWEGTGLRCAEGPHILKENGWYYAILAEGGTGFGHQISVGRSKSLWGPYESSPYNPVLTQKDEEASIQRTGHGKLVKTQNNEWWVIYLCGRINEGKYTTIGRETALDKVIWTDDEWFIINESKGPSAENKVPNLSWTPYEVKHFDDFEKKHLSYEWEFVRNPKYQYISLSKKESYISIVAGEYDLSEIKSYNTIVRRETEHKYTASLKMEFKPFLNGQQAGMTCYYGTNNYIKCYMIYDDGVKLRVQENRNGIKTIRGEKIIDKIVQEIYLKVCVINQLREFYYSFDNKVWKLIGAVQNCSFLSDEGVEIGKHHTGTLVGIYVYNGENKERAEAFFDWFNYEL